METFFREFGTIRRKPAIKAEAALATVNAPFWRRTSQIPKDGSVSAGPGGVYRAEGIRCKIDIGPDPKRSDRDRERA